MNLIEMERNKKIKELKKTKEIILSNYELELLMYDSNDRKDNGTYADYIWFKVYKDIALKNNEKYDVLDYVENDNNIYNISKLNLSNSELLLLELGETEEEVALSLERYYKILNDSKNIIGVKLNKIEIDNLLHIIENCKPTKEENETYYSNIVKKPNSKVYCLKGNG